MGQFSKKYSSFSISKEIGLSIGCIKNLARTFTTITDLSLIPCKPNGIARQYFMYRQVDAVFNLTPFY
jgi:hypothetical protein